MATENQPQTSDGWKSRIGVILAVAGSAVGLGNFLRFPGQAADNGGGAFMIPYFISLLILGIPLAWAEWTMGRYGGKKGFHSGPGIFTAIWPNKSSKYFGSLALLIPLVIYMYYVVIEAWCLGYAWNYLVGTEGLVSKEANYGGFFEGFVGIGEDGALLSSGNRQLLYTLIVTFAINFILIYRGVGKGIEMFCKVAVPFMVVLAVIVLIRVMTLGTPDPALPDQSVAGGLGFMWNPDFSKIWDAKTWLAASGQIFFSLSVGFGVIVNYASYLKEKDDVALSGLTASSMNEFFEVCLGGLITLPAAFIFLGVGVQDFTGSTLGIGFVALPNVFAHMPAGQFFGFLWFFMLFVAAVTSSISMLQPCIAFLEEGFGLKRHASASILGLIAASGCGFVMYFSKGLTALDTFDFWVGSFLIFVLAMIQAILYGWVFGIERGDQELHEGAHIRVPYFVQFILKYIVPVYMLAIFIGFCYQKMGSYVSAIGDSPVALGSILYIGVVLAFLLIMIHIAGLRWQKEGRIKALIEDRELAERTKNENLINEEANS
ncbi:sodium-dependent transporter [Calycomorphotria hydatis]|uniref:Sodium:neurotransmitter symporter family protein n=1 Tax=Calycomorphotria hydatis TaxID=2528027 RepID=A0A517T7Q2_9PLAN|nr:sodium-dependent transporter [Calycomorphotria hydatis]QDT64404.1 Sodium:neurotransmitter symporter family protein [Calycomorphotria hydatis]